MQPVRVSSLALCPVCPCVHPVRLIILSVCPACPCVQPVRVSSLSVCPACPRVCPACPCVRNVCSFCGHSSPVFASGSGGEGERGEGLRTSQTFQSLIRLLWVLYKTSTNFCITLLTIFFGLCAVLHMFLYIPVSY